MSVGYWERVLSSAAIADKWPEWMKGRQYSQREEEIMGADYTEEELKLSELRIEKDVPRRPRYPHGGFAAIASQMEVGDSIFCADSRQVNGLTMALNKLGRQIETRRDTKDGVEGRRIWRVD